MRSGTPVIQSNRFYAFAAIFVVLVILILLLLGTILGLSAWIGTEVDDLDLDVDVDVGVNVTVEDEEESCLKWVYAVPFVCGESFSIVNETIVRADAHAFTMFVFNQNQDDATFSKKISMTYPPGGQLPGPVYTSPINDTLLTWEALEMTCIEIRNLIMPPVVRHHPFAIKNAHRPRDTGTLIKGVASVETDQELTIWGTQTSSRESVVELIPQPDESSINAISKTDAITFDKEHVVGICVERGVTVPIEGDGILG